MMPAAFIVIYGIEKYKNLKGLVKWIRYFFLAIISLYWGYLAITIAYWYFLELNAEGLDKVLVNPIFIWMVIGFFVLLEFILFRKMEKKESQLETITIYSDRKKTTLQKNYIAYVESRGDFTLVMMKDGNELKNNVKISEWEFKLDHFLRIHRSFLINPTKSIFKGSEVIVNGEWPLPVSRSYKPKVKDYFEGSAN